MPEHIAVVVLFGCVIIYWWRWSVALNRIIALEAQLEEHRIMRQVRTTL